MPGAIQTFGIPPQTYIVHNGANAGAQANRVLPYRIVTATDQDRQVTNPGGPASTGDIVGVAQTERPRGHGVAVRELGESLVLVTQAVTPGLDAVIADAEGRARPFAAGDVKRAGTFRSRTPAGQLAVIDLDNKNTPPLA